MKGFSQAAQKLVGQPMFNFMAKARDLEAQGINIVHFEIGDPDFSSPQVAKDWAIDAIRNDCTHYTNSFGMPEFRQAIREDVWRIAGFTPDLEQVLVCPANAVIDFVARCVVNPEEEVIIPDPGFSTYSSVIAYNNMVPICVQLKEENDFRMEPGDIEQSITDKTRLIIVNSPGNPTGSIMTKKDAEEIAGIAQRNDLYLLTDETYSLMLYDELHYTPSIADQCRERTIILNSLSKTYAMSGWRLGYAIGPPELIAKMGLLLQTIVSCFPAFTQWGGVAALREGPDILSERLQILKKRRDRLITGLNQLPGMSCLMPRGAFYAFANISGTGMDCNEYSNRLLDETGVCVLPGNCLGRSGEGYIRLCYAGTAEKVIDEAISRMKTFHRGLGR